MIDPIECPDCAGYGECLQEVAVSAPMAWRGGYLDEKWAECPTCEGLGLVERPEADYDN